MIGNQQHLQSQIRVLRGTIYRLEQELEQLRQSMGRREGQGKTSWGLGMWAQLLSPAPREFQLPRPRPNRKHTRTVKSSVPRMISTQPCAQAN
jgi:hypothetical protein